MTTSMTSKTQEDNPVPVDEQIEIVKNMIVEVIHFPLYKSYPLNPSFFQLDFEVNDLKFHAGKCFECINAAASIILLPCQHLIFCKKCFDRSYDPKRALPNTLTCILCGKIYGDSINVLP